MVRKMAVAAVVLGLVAAGAWVGETPAQEAAVKLSDKQYVDPKGFFKIIPPEGWKVTEYPQDPRGKVAFIGPEQNVELRVLTNAVEITSVDQLVAFCKDVEKRLGFNTNIKKGEYFGRTGVQRSFTIKGVKVVAHDFLVGKVDHNLQFSAPQDKFEKYLPLVNKSMETYEPILKQMTGEDLKKHQVAKKLRLAQLMMEQKNYDMARGFVKEGLEVDPKNQELLKLNEELKKKK